MLVSTYKLAIYNALISIKIKMSVLAFNNRIFSLKIKVYSECYSGLSTSRWLSAQILYDHIF